MTDFKLPELGEGVRKAEVIRVLVKAGDHVKAEQSVFEVESEKAAMALPAPVGGRVAKVHVHEGDEVAVGQVLLSIEGGDGDQKELPAQEKAPATKAAAKEKPAEEKATHDKPPEKKAEPPAAKPSQADIAADSATLPAGPATRRLARELGVDLHQVTGSGAGGRITPEDVQAAVRQRGTDGEISVPALPDFARWGAVERQALNALARTSAQRLQLAWRLVPHVTQHAVADITDLEAARQRLEYPDVKITMTSILTKAAVVALKAMPHFNSSYDAAKQELILKRYYHIGVAVDTKQGLLVPVIRDADRKSMRAIAIELTELAEKARNRQLTLEHMQGGTFTISNLGGIGGTAFTPIVNYPEVAILGVGRSYWQLVQQQEKIVNRLMLPLSLSYDHRVVNGADGARFVTLLANMLADSVKLLVEV
jgi:pyruvate dehydrogenase E2 component (dihydrolipoamide acetyltransferase)